METPQHSLFSLPSTTLTPVLLFTNTDHFSHYWQSIGCEVFEGKDSIYWWCQYFLKDADLNRPCVENAT